MRILLLAGGDSNERSVSLDSGRAVYEALKRLDHIVYVIDPATGKSLLNSDGSFIDQKSDEARKPIVPKKSSTWSLSKNLGSPAFQDIDIVVITLHGGSGEDGMLQCMIEIAGKKYTGSNMSASAFAMDKAITKRICLSENIKTADFAVYRLNSDSIDNRLIEEISHRFSFPLIIKPNDGGSTIGLSKVDHEDGIRDALRKSSSESQNILVEKFIPGREITAAVLGGKALPLVEIKPKKGLYDFEAKYKKGASEYICPAELPEKMTAAIQQAAVKMYNIVGCNGLARADFILDEHMEFYFLELNTLPGMTELSLAPMAAKAAGYEFDTLITEILKAAL